MSDITLVTEYNEDMIKLSLDYDKQFSHFDRIANDIVLLKEKGVREALVKLGWTPPPKNGGETPVTKLVAISVLDRNCITGEWGENSYHDNQLTEVLEALGYTVEIDGEKMGVRL